MYGTAAAVLALGLIVLGWRMWAYVPASQPDAESAVSLPASDIDPSTLALYSSGEHGISFFYPAEATLEEERGSDLVSSVTYQDLSVQVLVRTASDAADCYASTRAQRSAGEQEIGGRSWRVLVRETLGTENERIVTQYRALDGSRCITVESSKPVGVEAPSALAATILSGISLAPLRTEAAPL